MKESDIVEVLQDFISGKFPKACPACGKRYDSLAEYLQGTTHAGMPVSYDAEIGDWNPDRPIGTVSLANCSCGSTMGIGSSGMKLKTMWRLMFWARREAADRGVGVSEILEDLRRKIDQRVLRDESREATSSPPAVTLDAPGK